MKSAVVVVLLVISAANWGNSIRAVVAFVIARRAVTIMSLSESFALEQALVVIGDTILSANRSVGIRARLAF